MLPMRTPLGTVLVSGWLALGLVGAPLWAGFTGGEAPSATAVPDPGDAKRRPGGDAGRVGAEVQESKQASRQEAMPPLRALDAVPPVVDAGGPLGAYEQEGYAQGEPIEAILGLRADRSPVAPGLRALEAREEIEDAAGWVVLAQATSRQGTHRPEQVDAAPGFGANVCFQTGLIRRLQADARSWLDRSGRYPRVLDVGAGVGYNAERLAKLGVRVVANDQSTEQLAILRRWLQSVPGTLRNIHLNDGDIFDKAFPGGTFDGILASHLFHYLSPQELQILVVRFHTWLRPGGRLYIQCWNIEAPIFTWFRPVWAMNKAAGIPWPGCIPHPRELDAAAVDGELPEEWLESFGDYLHAIELEDLLKLLEASGFTLVEHGMGDTQVLDPFRQWETFPGCQVMVVAEKPAPEAGGGGGAGQR